MNKNNILLGGLLLASLYAKVDINETVNKAVESFFQEDNLKKYKGVDAVALFIQSADKKTNYLLNINKSDNAIGDFALGECVELTQEQTEALKNAKTSKNELSYAISISNLVDIIKNSKKIEQKASVVDSIKMHDEIKDAQKLSNEDVVKSLASDDTILANEIKITEEDVKLFAGLQVSKEEVSEIIEKGAEKGTLASIVIGFFDSFKEKSFDGNLDEQEVFDVLNSFKTVTESDNEKESSLEDHEGTESPKITPIETVSEENLSAEDINNIEVNIENDKQFIAEKEKKLINLKSAINKIKPNDRNINNTKYQNAQKEVVACELSIAELNLNISEKQEKIAGYNLNHASDADKPNLEGQNTEAKITVLEMKKALEVAKKKLNDIQKLIQ
ncbi:hypothetical protein [Candidatus Cytomitobacter primus]|uniref:Uncharacterized protein n=1 Tax=Candidatus Cytomitobacter primus TaxID=2066024 RepID=A0A5C0UI01_9PROT|nr:hypothetical protein [Candidatus Cytomitobacter primus]QEK38574.1 hypothetical protein FZC34_01455 [Candidatus Cytomitobacter primus]